MFFIFLYQRWIYRVDPKRVNEFGTSGEDHNPSTTTQAVTQGEIDTGPHNNEPPVEEGTEHSEETVKTDQEKKDD